MHPFSLLWPLRSTGARGSDVDQHRPNARAGQAEASPSCSARTYDVNLPLALNSPYIRAKSSQSSLLDFNAPRDGRILPSASPPDLFPSGHVDLELDPLPAPSAATRNTDRLARPDPGRYARRPTLSPAVGASQPQWAHSPFLSWCKCKRCGRLGRGSCAACLDDDGGRQPPSIGRWPSAVSHTI